MGTRGLMAFAHDGELKGSYNHFDSYPSGLGADLAKFIAGGFDAEQVKELFKALEPVNEDEKPTVEQQAALLQYFDDRVSTRSSEEWYALLRHTQGEPAEFLKAHYYIDGIAFAQDSLFCEWAYVIDLDNEVLEIYKGFQNEPHSEGRFATGEEKPEEVYSGGSRYYPVRLVKVVSFADIKAEPDIMDRLEKEFYADDEE